jgi:GNAT superfamily N-acetyltransferase
MVKEIRDRERILQFLLQDPFLHVYSIGDLDEFFWPYTRWFSLSGPDGIEALFLLYTADSEYPTLLAFEERRPERAEALLRELSRRLPPHFRAHISDALEPACRSLFPVGHARRSLKMRLDRGALRSPPLNPIPLVRLGRGDLSRVLAFYSEAYPENFFDPRMLETGQYLGVEQAHGLVAVAGIHVYSGQYRVAALGNIATHPAFRRRGFGVALTHRLCSNLFETVDFIGLNVRRENEAAIRCYEQLGFRIHSAFLEVEVGGGPA